MTPVERLAAAEINSTLARARLQETIGSLQARIEPKRLMRETRAQLAGVSGTAADRITAAGGTAAMRSADTARRNPKVISAIVGAGILLLTRHRIARLFRHRSKPNLVPKPGQDFR